MFMTEEWFFDDSPVSCQYRLLCGCVTTSS